MIDAVPHGGGLAAAMARHGGERADWLDLSTGINPEPPRPPAPLDDDLARLPDADLEAAAVQAARAFHGFPAEAAVIPVAGIQGVIPFLPLLRAPGFAMLASPTYGEYGPALRRSGWVVRPGPERATLGILVNPNNPDGAAMPRDAVLALARELGGRGGLLIVDEAFGGLADGLSVERHAGVPGLLVLTSFGKFFGLAGLRLGFAAGHGDDIARLKRLAGPWAVNGPALRAAAGLMRVPGMRGRIAADIRAKAARQKAVLEAAGLTVVADAGLFILASHPRADALHRALLDARVLTRAFDGRPDWLRFGLCAGARDLDRLTARLADAMKTCI